MFTVSYRFNIYPKQNEAFEESWKQVTKLIYRHCGSLGSRLYKSSETTYLGIAQWPDKQTWDQSSLEGLDPENWRSRMRACCELIEKLEELELVHDLWKDIPFSDV